MNAFDRAVDSAIARENANPQGLPPEDIAALDVPYTPTEEGARTYVIYPPVTITVHGNTVTAEVDFSEADDDIRTFDTNVAQLDATIVQNAVIQAIVEVKY